jgi:hypothetical protein
MDTLHVMQRGRCEHRKKQEEDKDYSVEHLRAVAVSRFWELALLMISRFAYDGLFETDEYFKVSKCPENFQQVMTEKGFKVEAGERYYLVSWK